jgi:endogenous inhibitor of DNA gyrase (YacG/DUF329 family)
MSHIRKRLYVFDCDDFRIAVVHSSLKEAKKWMWNDCDVRAYCDDEYVLFNPYWLREIDVSDLKVGDDLLNIVGIKRGVYDWIDWNCPICGRLSLIQHHDDWDVICCSRCEDALYKQWQVALNEVCDAHIYCRYE